MVLLSRDWIGSNIQTTPAHNRRSWSNLAFPVLAMVLLSVLAVLSVAFGGTTLEPAIFAAP